VGIGFSSFFFPFLQSQIMFDIPEELSGWAWVAQSKKLPAALGFG